ncbi:hypothetical protein OKW43_003662 [Paraburkholderia sp. WC7.3g]
MKPFAATARAGSAVALLALSGCYYVGSGYYPYGYYPAVPTVATQHEVPAQGYGLPNGADAQNIRPASPGEPSHVAPAPMYVAPAYYPAYYPPTRGMAGRAGGGRRCRSASATGAVDMATGAVMAGTGEAMAIEPPSFGNRAA